MSDERLLAAVQRVLDGDESIKAAHELERVLVDDYPGDERFDELVEVLSLYAPGRGRPYSDAIDVQRALMQTINDLA